TTTRTGARRARPATAAGTAARRAAIIPGVPATATIRGIPSAVARAAATLAARLTAPPARSARPWVWRTRWEFRGSEDHVAGVTRSAAPAACRRASLG